jgi:hypothetical protein
MRLQDEVNRLYAVTQAMTASTSKDSLSERARYYQQSGECMQLDDE